MPQSFSLLNNSYIAVREGYRGCFRRESTELWAQQRGASDAVAYRNYVKHLILPVQSSWENGTPVAARQCQLLPPLPADGIKCYLIWDAMLA